jgi:hypothetical protein
VGRAPLHRDAILVFNPKMKKIFVCHSFKFLSEDEPVSNTYVFGSPIGDVAAPHVDDLRNDAFSDTISDQQAEFIFLSDPNVHLDISLRLPTCSKPLLACIKVVISHLRYCPIVYIEVSNVYCFQYYDTDKFKSSPTSTSDFEY